jgi:SAM-dependent methyltransferase
MTTGLDERTAAYLTTNRDFCAPSVAAAIDALDVPSGARVLEIGPGAGGALPLLAGAAGPGGSVLAVDRDPAVAALAAAYAGDVAEVRTADALDVVADESFDLIWASDVVWPGNFADPGAAVRALVSGLRPGGTLALLSSGYYRATFLPGHSRLELLARIASFRRWRLPVDGPHQHDRHLSWLLAAGATDTVVRVLPRVGFPDEPTVRAYLEGTVWPEIRESVAEHGAWAGLTDADRERLDALTTPGGPHYVVDEPGYHVVQPAVLTTGRA